MSWVRLDDRLPHHKKVRSIPPKLVKAAYGIYVASIQFCQHYETDGAIRREDLGLILPSCPKPTAAEIAALVNCGLWDEGHGGWFVHNYLKHNLSAEQRRQAKQANQTRQDRYRHGLSDASRNALPTPSPTTPTPLLSSPTPLHSTKTPLLSERPDGFSATGGSDAVHAIIQAVSSRLAVARE